MKCIVPDPDIQSPKTELQIKDADGPIWLSLIYFSRWSIGSMIVVWYIKTGICNN